MIKLQKWALMFTIVIMITGGHYSTAQSPVSFKDCAGQALLNNYGLQMVRNQEDMAKNNFTPGHAGFLPSVEGSLRHSSSIIDSRQIFLTRPEPQEVENAKSTSLAGSVLLTWQVFDGFRMFIRHDMLENIHLTSSLATKYHIENLVARVASEFYDYLLQKKNLETYAHIMELSRERKDLAYMRYVIGQFSKLEYQQALVDYNADSSRYIVQTENLDRSLIRLATTLAVDHYKAISPEDSFVINKGLDYATLYNSMLQNNTELQIKLNNIELGALEIKQARSYRYPALSLNGGYNANRRESQAGFLIEGSDRGWSYGASLTLPIFNAFEKNRIERNLKLDLENTRLSYEETLTKLKGDFSLFYNNYTNSLHLINLEEQNLEVAYENYMIAMERYRIGNLSGIEMRDIQRAYLDAEFRLMVARYQAKMAEVTLKQISGTISEYL